MAGNRVFLWGVEGCLKAGWSLAINTNMKTHLSVMVNDIPCKRCAATGRECRVGSNQRACGTCQRAKVQCEFPSMTDDSVPVVVGDSAKRRRVDMEGGCAGTGVGLGADVVVAGSVASDGVQGLPSSAPPTPAPLPRGPAVHFAASKESGKAEDLFLAMFYQEKTSPDFDVAFEAFKKTVAEGLQELRRVGVKGVVDHDVWMEAGRWIFDGFRGKGQPEEMEEETAAVDDGGRAAELEVEVERLRKELAELRGDYDALKAIQEQEPE